MKQIQLSFIEGNEYIVKEDIETRSKKYNRFSKNIIEERYKSIKNLTNEDILKIILENENLKVQLARYEKLIDMLK